MCRLQICNNGYDEKKGEIIIIEAQVFLLELCLVCTYFRMISFSLSGKGKISTPLKSQMV